MRDEAFGIDCLAGDRFMGSYLEQCASWSLERERSLVSYPELEYLSYDGERRWYCMSLPGDRPGDLPGDLSALKNLPFT